MHFFEELWKTLYWSNFYFLFINNNELNIQKWELNKGINLNSKKNLIGINCIQIEHKYDSKLSKITFHHA